MSFPGSQMPAYWFPLGSQLVPILLCEPRLLPGSVWCLPEIPGVWFCSADLYRRKGHPVCSWKELG